MGAAFVQGNILYICLVDEHMGVFSFVVGGSCTPCYRLTSLLQDTFKRFLAEEPEVDEFTPELIANSSRQICSEIAIRAEQLKKHSHLIKYSTLLYENVKHLHIVRGQRPIFLILGTFSQHKLMKILMASKSTKSLNDFPTVN